MNKNDFREESLFLDLADEKYENFIIEDNEKLEQISLNSAEKTRIYDNVLINISKIKHNSEYKQKKRSSFFYTGKAIPLLVAFVLILCTSVVAATGNLKIDKKITDFGNLNSVQKAEAEVDSVSEEKAAGIEKLEISNAQAVCYGNNISASFVVHMPDGFKLDESCLFGNVDVRIGDEVVAPVYTYEFEEIGENTTKVFFNLQVDEPLNSDKIFIDITDICQYVDNDAAGSTQAEPSYTYIKTLLAGNWTIACDVNFRDDLTEIEYQVNQTIVDSGNKYVWDKLVLTPFSAILYFEGYETYDLSSVFDEFVITLKDGSTLTQDDCKIISPCEGQINVSFGKYINWEQVESIGIGDYVYSIIAE